ncbi:MAG: CRISPR-associated endoribonuclease Cas6 [Elusimicrobiales bacterium]
MQLYLKAIREKDELILPIHHNEILQGVVYSHLGEQLAERIHTTGVKDPESDRGLKLFTFSRIISVRKPIIDEHEKKIKFPLPITWVVASPLYEFVVSFYNNLIKKHTIHIQYEEQVLHLYHIWVKPPPSYKKTIFIETLSPITVYRTEERDGKTFTHYYSPQDPEFNKLILLNLLRKYRTLTGKNITLDDAYIKPVRVAKRENILYFKDTVIKGWSGIFELSLPKELFTLAFSCGLGAKNSQGFGCIGIWRGNL